MFEESQSGSQSDSETVAVGSEGETEDGLVGHIASRRFITESYKLDPEIRSQALEMLKVARCSCDLFAERANAQELHYIDRRENAWTFDWGIFPKAALHGPILPI